MIKREKHKNKISAPGKIILSGEHAVVYGYPALASAINRRLRVDFSSAKDITISSNIPMGGGMGSSAAYAVCFSATQLLLQGKKWDLDEVNKRAYEIEKKHHGNPSGVDNTISTYGGFLWYRKEAENLKLFSRLTPKIPLPRLYIIDSGKPSEPTSEMITFVKDRLTKRKDYIKSIFKDIERTTRSFLNYLLDEESTRLEELIDENEQLLEALGVVSESTKDLILKIKRLGGHAKISGAGGRKTASGIILVYHTNDKKIMQLADKHKLNLSSVSLGEEGVRIERTG